MKDVSGVFLKYVPFFQNISTWTNFHQPNLNFCCVHTEIWAFQGEFVGNIVVVYFSKYLLNISIYYFTTGGNCSSMN